MTYKEQESVMVAALDKAHANGFFTSGEDYKKLFHVKTKDGGITERTIEAIMYYQHLPMIIYNHDFAKALWGEEPMELGSEPVYPRMDLTTYIEPWKYHLQRMVIADDPIQYLAEHI